MFHKCQLNQVCNHVFSYLLSLYWLLFSTWSVSYWDKSFEIFQYICRLKKRKITWSHQLIKKKIIKNIQYPFMIKIFIKIAIEWDFVNLIKSTYQQNKTNKNPTLISYLMIRLKTECLPLQLETRQDVCSHHLYST